MAEKIPYGALDIAARELEEAEMNLEDIWKIRRHSVRPEDVERMKKCLDRIGKAEKNIMATLEMFANLS